MWLSISLLNAKRNMECAIGRHKRITPVVVVIQEYQGMHAQAYLNIFDRLSTGYPPKLLRYGLSTSSTKPSLNSTVTFVTSASS